jgi:uncharacterized protein YuzE
MPYFEKDDVLHFAISDEPEAGSVEVSPNITAELNTNGELIGIEILSASTFIRDFVLESVQTKVLDLAQPRRRDKTFEIWETFECSTIASERFLITGTGGDKPRRYFLD